MTTKRLNIKFLAALGIGSIVFLGAVYGIHEWQVKRHAAGLLSRAEAARTEGDLQESARLRRRYLHHLPDLSDESLPEEQQSVYQYKQAAIDMNQFVFDKLERNEIPVKVDLDAATQAILLAAEKCAGDPEVSRMVVKYFTTLNAPTVVVKHCEALEKMAENGNAEAELTDEDILRYISALRKLGGANEGKALQKLHDLVGWNRAAREFDKQGTHSSLIPAYQVLVQMVMQKDLDREASVKVLNEMVRRNPDDPQAYLARSRMIRAVRGGDGVEQSHADIQTAFDKAPEDLDVIRSMSAMMLETEREEDAKRLLQLGLDQAETMQEKAALYLLLSEIYVRAKDLDGALDVLNRANREVTLNRDLLLSKTRILLDQQRFDEVEKMFEQLKDARLGDATVSFFKARILMANGKYLEASRGLEKVLSLLPTDQMKLEGQFYLAEAYGRTGKYDLQLRIMEQLRERNPDNEQVNQSYYAILVQLQQFQKAKQFLEQRILALQQAGQPIPRNYAALLANLKMRDAQIGVSSLSDAEQAALREQIAEAANDESLTDEQRKRYVLQQIRQNPDRDQAKKMVQNMIRQDMENFELWTTLLDLSSDQEETERFLSLMESKVDTEKYGAAMEMVRLNLALKYSPDTFPDVAREIEGSLTQYDESQQMTLRYRLGQQYLQFDDYDTGKRLLLDVVKSPNASASVKVDVLGLLLDVSLRRDDQSEVDFLVQSTRDVVGETDESYRMAEARRIVWQIRKQLIPETSVSGELSRARNLIESIRQSRSTWVPGILVEADLLLLERNHSAAIERLQEAHGFQPTNPRIIRNIASTYRALGRTTEADQWLARIPKNLVNRADRRDELNALWARRGGWSVNDQQAAIKLVEQVVPLDKAEPRDLLFRSRVHLFSRTDPLTKKPIFLPQYDEAEAAVKKASQLAPEMADVWTHWVNICVGQEDLQKASKVIQQASTSVPEEERMLTLGRCFSIAGDIGKAQKAYVAALEKDKDNMVTKQLLAQTLMRIKDPKAVQAAAQLIQSIVATAETKAKDENYQATPQDISIALWARRTLATLLVSNKSYANFEQALKFLEGNAVQGTILPQDVITYVSLCAQREEKTSWERGLLFLDQVQKTRKEQKLTDIELFGRAQLLERFGDEYWDEVQKLATDVLSRIGDNPKIVEGYVQWLLKRGEVQDAERLADRNLDPKSVLRFRVDVHSDAKRGDFQRAQAKIKARLPQSYKNEAAKAELLTIATITEELGQYDERYFGIAEVLLKQVSKLASQETLRIAMLLGRKGNDTDKVNQALQMCMQSGQYQIAADRSASVAINVLRLHPEKWDGALANSVQQFGQWIEQQVSQNPNNFMIKWRAAEFFDLIGDLDRAEVKYQDILNTPDFKNPTQRGMILNNLAYVMALNGKSTEPLQLIAEAEELLPPSAALTDTKGYVLLVNGDVDQAIAAFQEAIRLGPKNGHKYFHLALAFDAKQDRDSALTSWQEAVKLGLDRFGLPPALREDYDKLASKFGGVASRDVTPAFAAGS